MKKLAEQTPKPTTTPKLNVLSRACLQQVVGGTLVYLNRTRQKEL